MSKNTIIPSIKDQALVLDRLAEFYFSWIDSFVELISEMTWEISFKKLRAVILYLVEFWYIQRSYTWKWNEFYVKITKKWIVYYEEIFSSENVNNEKKLTFLEKIKKVSEWVGAVKWIATWVVAVFTILWVWFHSEISNQFSAKILQTNEKNEIVFTQKEAIRFLKNKFENVKFNCVFIQKNTFSCKVIKDKKLQVLHWSFEEKRLVDKKIILRKWPDWEIFLVK